MRPLKTVSAETKQTKSRKPLIVFTRVVARPVVLVLKELTSLLRKPSSRAE
jgi:hypothetical protein